MSSPTPPPAGRFSGPNLPDCGGKRAGEVGEGKEGGGVEGSKQRGQEKSDSSVLPHHRQRAGRRKRARAAQSPAAQTGKRPLSRQLFFQRADRRSAVGVVGGAGLVCDAEEAIEKTVATQVAAAALRAMARATPVPRLRLAQRVARRSVVVEIPRKGRELGEVDHGPRE
jgi:hypothetical protein